MPIKADLKAKWDALPDATRSKTKTGGIIAAVLLVIFVGYYASGQQKNKPAPKPTVALINTGDSKMQDDMRAQAEKERQEARNQNDEQNKKIDDMSRSEAATQGQLDTITAALKSMGAKVDAQPSKDGKDAKGKAEAPPWPEEWQQPPAGKEAKASRFGSMPVATPIPTAQVGDIGMLKATVSVLDSKKKANPKFFLPVSFMPAMLLTGLKAKTVENAKGDPEPLLLRVQAPAVLPNDIRAALKGCLVVANGFGSLSSERVETKLVSINCLDFAGRSIIEADIKGIVVDADGVKGLAGHPVSKAGANMARAVLAGGFAGAGQALSQSATTTSTSALGSTQTVDPSQIGRAALGTGLSKGADEIAKVYLELVRQSAPVIEVGPAKEVTVVVTEGVWLEVKPYEQ